MYLVGGGFPDVAVRAGVRVEGPARLLRRLNYPVRDRQVGGADVGARVGALVLGGLGARLSIRVAGLGPPVAAPLPHHHLLRRLPRVPLTVPLLDPYLVSVQGAWVRGRGRAPLFAGLLSPGLGVGSAVLVRAAGMVAIWSWLLLWRSCP